MKIYKDKIISLLKDATWLSEISLEVPPDPKMGDFAFPCFSLSKEQKKAPQKIASELAEKINAKKEPWLHKAEPAGPYLNFFVDPATLAASTLDEISSKKKDYGQGIPKKQRVMFEFPSPNTNKPLHLGHIRNMLLGRSCAKICSASGYDIVQVNLNNDRGVHICKSMLAYSRWGDGKEPDKKSDHFVGDFYVLFSQKAKEDESLEKQAQDMLVRWENGDKEVISLWKKMRKWSLDGFGETYKKLDLKFDREYYESEIYLSGKEIILDALKKGLLAKEDDGAVYVDLEKDKLGKKYLLRSDGTTVYMTQDIFLAKKKFDDFKMDKSVYVVGNEQDYHFKVLFKTLKVLGYKFADNCYHLSYGMVNLPSGKMKSREGTVVDADDMISDMISLAKEELKKRYPELGCSELEKRAEVIGLGALRFFILKYEPSKDMTFNPDESLSFEGETGPYVQYAHARICSILEKHGAKLKKEVDYSLLKEDIEKNILGLLARYPEIVSEAAEHYKPSLVTRYLIDLAQLFNEYYHGFSVLKAQDSLRDTRLVLISCVKEVLRNGLSLLDIESPEKM